jgi:hypothetical protein
MSLNLRDSQICYKIKPNETRQPGFVGVAQKVAQLILSEQKPHKR